MEGGKKEEGPSISDEIREFGPYTLQKELGRGAQGVVYLAEHRQLRRKVALKMLAGAAAQSAAVRDRFQREAEITSKLDHPGICGIHEVGEIQGIPYIAMQYLRGITLAELIQRAQAQAGKGTSVPRIDPGETTASLTGKEATQDVLLMIERAARALHAAHEAGLVHRDIKPGNIMISPDGQPVLLDFGLARDVEDHGHTLTETGAVMGTPAYMSPEQLRAQREQTDRRTDVYSLGVTLYECLTLRRPFEAPGFEQLYTLILQGVPPNPRKLNARIPIELRTVIEVAMERDPARRYATALDLAEDLRRVRSFEPIRAKAADPLLRTRRWVRREPAKAVAILAVIVFVLAGGVFLVGDRLARRAAARDHLIRAEALLGSGEYTGALEAVARSRERAPNSTQALELKARIESERDRANQEARKQDDLRAAAAAREESRQKQQEHAEASRAIAALKQSLQRDHGRVFGTFAGSEARSAFARGQSEFEQRRLEAERLLMESQESLERAARLEAPWGRSPETEAAFAGFFLDRWREAVEEGDGPRTALFRSLVERHDPGGIHGAELLGRGTMTVTLDPPDAEAHLFRYESYETVRPGDPIPRLVPVPTKGVGRSREGAWAADFHPGDMALRITRVEARSPADDAGLRAGDLVIRLNEEPVANGLFVTSIGTSGPLVEAGVAPLTRVRSLNRVEIATRMDWNLAPAVQGGTDRVGFFGRDGEIAIDRGAVDLATAEELVARGSSAASLEVLCLREGEPIELYASEGEPTGIECELSAYPLICSADNRIPAGESIEIDPGSYLLHVRRSGHEDERHPIAVKRQGRAELRVKLLRSGSTPPGFVPVPAGEFTYGGDPEVEEPAPAEQVQLPGFFIARRELTNSEWAEFVEDPRTQEKIQASSGPTYEPRETNRNLIPKENLGGPTTPVMGISWNEVADYLVWRNERARAAGEPWVFDLPSEKEWEKAARGVDGRSFPWGDRFDFEMAVGFHSRPWALYNAPGGFEPRDESPYGVQDLGGLRLEWTRDENRIDPQAPPFYRVRGGGWTRTLEKDFRCASRYYQDASLGGGQIGFRLVARPEEPGGSAAGEDPSEDR